MASDTPGAGEDVFPYQIVLPDSSVTTEWIVIIASFQFLLVAQPQIKQQQHYLTFYLDLKS